MDALDHIPLREDSTSRYLLEVDGPDIGPQFAPLLAEQFQVWLTARCADFETGHDRRPSRLSIQFDLIVE